MSSLCRDRAVSRIAGAVAAAAVMGLLLLSLHARSQALSAVHRFPIYDEIDYLRLARGVEARGGVPALAREHAAGSYREENRHPLFIALMAPFMTGKTEDFPRAKLIALACALFFVAASGAAAFKGPLPRAAAFAAAGWAALSPCVVRYAQTVAPDLLFAGLFALAVSLAADARARARSWFAFGLLAGLAWLAKGNGHFLLLLPLTASWFQGRQAWRRPAPLAAVGGFIVSGGLLLWRNLLVWGQPFHHLLNKVIWLADGDNCLPLMLSPEWDKIGPAWYWQQFTLHEIASHAGHGIMAAAGGLLRAMSSGPSGNLMESVIGALFLTLALLGLKRSWAAGERLTVWIVAAAVVPLWLAFAWGAKTGHSYVRFHLPLAAVLIPFALGELRARAPARWGSGTVRVLLLAAALACLSTSGQALLFNPMRSWGVPEFWSETSAWLRSHAGEGYLVDNWSYYSNWDAPPETRRDAPLHRSRTEVLGYARRFGARFIVVDLGLYRFDAHPDKFGPADAWGPTTYIGWPRCFRAKGVPSPLIVYGERCPTRGLH